MHQHTMDILSQWEFYQATLWLIGVLVFLFGLYRAKQYFRKLRLLSKIPGPTGYPILGNTKMALLKPVELFYTLNDLAKIHYPIYKFSVGYSSVVVIMSPDDIEMVISKMKHLKKGDLYVPLHNWLKEGLLLSDGAKWQHRRKLLTPTFHFTILNQFTKVFMDESKKLVEDIRNVSNEPVEVLSVISKFTLQSICETAMGTKLAEHEAGEKYKDAIYKTGALVINRYVTPWEHNHFLHKLTPNYWRSRSLLKYLHKFTMNVIKVREKSFDIADVELKENNLSSRKRLAMLDLLLLAKMKGNNIDDVGIQEEVDTFLFEGHDTTAASITFSLMLLASHKNVQDAVFEEVKSILNDSKRDFTMEDLNEMKYLERVIKESLRLYPSVPSIGRALSEDVVTPSGYYIPKDTTILINIYAMHHDPNNYKDPEKFDADRFIPENFKGSRPYAYVPFSAGPRNCIGQKFAMLEMKAAIGTIIRHFELYPIDTPGTIQLKTDVILRTSKPILVVFQTRQDPL